ncbi:hypothetical protein J4217_02975 [Candidatus Pacearchaeota archaeon]|nr:hypothetical protein [Candidatus Pacearchaeota archaeon]
MINNKRAQLAIFVIIAIVLVAGIGAYFLIKGKIGPGAVSSEFSSVYEYYSSCIQEKTSQAVDIAGSQGGKIDVGNYILGSEYAPFSSHLNFLGFPVPYWFYVSGNGVVKENVPSKGDIQNEIADYIENNIGNCDYESFYAKGITIKFGNPVVKATINDNSVSVSVSAKVVVSKGGQTSSKNSYSVNVNSKFGKFYDIAQNIYNKEKIDAFLENYTVDVLRLYAPVDGVETSCSPKVWKTLDVENDLKDGLEANIAAIKFRSTGDKYFVAGNVDENVNLIYSRNWPTKLQIIGNNVDNALMIAQPLGSEQGLNLMGFCYIPYHFVYDLSFPVMVQIYDDNEIFQFPVVVIIDKNVPRTAELVNYSQEQDFDLCVFKTQDATIGIYNVDLNRVNANLTYKCLNQECNLGETTNGEFTGKVPACVNGLVVARANGYAEKKQIFSTNSESSTQLILDREYNVEVSVDVGLKEFNQNAIIAFENNDTGQIVSAILPGVKNVKLTEGNYLIKVYAYGNSSIVIPESKKTECRDIPKPGIFGFFGGTEEKCFDVTIPSTRVDSALIGGGKVYTYFLTSDLEKGKIKLKADELPKPTTIEQLQYNFESFDSLNLGVEFE